MGEGAWLVAFLGAQRLVELGLAQFNTGRLRAEGGVEFGAAHYPLMIVLHGLWLLGLWAFGHDQPINVFWLTVFVFLQTARLWVIASLGRRWTTRVIVLRGAAPVARARVVRDGEVRLVPASELSDRRPGNRGGSARAGPAWVRADFFDRQCGAACLSDPRRKRGAGLGRKAGMSAQRRNPCQ